MTEVAVTEALGELLSSQRPLLHYRQKPTIQRQRRRLLLHQM